MRLLWLLPQHAPVLQKLRSEQQDVLARHGEAVTEAALRDCPYLEATVKELLRVEASCLADADPLQWSCLIQGMLMISRPAEEQLGCEWLHAFHCWLPRRPRTLGAPTQAGADPPAADAGAHGMCKRRPSAAACPGWHCRTLSWGPTRSGRGTSCRWGGACRRKCWGPAACVRPAAAASRVDARLDNEQPPKAGPARWR
jgi:hypothetical protein